MSGGAEDEELAGEEEGLLPVGAGAGPAMGGAGAR
jgi:hypothetical protein